MPELTNSSEGREIEARVMDGKEPVTDHDSKTVMIAAERHDEIHINTVVDKFDEDVTIPDTVSVIKRIERYYGPELLVHATIDGIDHNFLLNAPGPASHLHLWAGETTSDNKRKSWFACAEVTAVLSAEQPPYETCNQCGERIRTIEHERMAVTGNCSRVGSWG